MMFKIPGILVLIPERQITRISGTPLTKFAAQGGKPWQCFIESMS